MTNEDNSKVTNNAPQTLQPVKEMLDLTTAIKKTHVGDMLRLHTSVLSRLVRGNVNEAVPGLHHPELSGPKHDWHLPHRAIDEETEGDTDVLLAEPETKKPPLYAVIIFNDDYTPMEFVVHVLIKYFKHNVERATEIMLNVHYKGKGIAGVYPRDIAETKAQQANKEARLEGHPLLCQIEPQG